MRLFPIQGRQDGIDYEALVFRLNLVHGRIGAIFLFKGHGYHEGPKFVMGADEAGDGDAGKGEGAESIGHSLESLESRMR